MHGLFDITNLIAIYGYVGIFIVVFLESGIFFALPGDSLLFTVGIFAASGALSIQFVIPLIFIATLTGGIFGYWVGVNIEKLRKYKVFRNILKQEYIQKADLFFKKHGRFAIIFSRFVPIIRTFAPIVAGVVKMNYKLFIRYSIISSILWSTSITLIGYFLGQSFPWIKEYMSIIVIIIVVASLLPILFEILRKKR